MIKRREFIAALGGLTVNGLLYVGAARSQAVPAQRMARVLIIMPGFASTTRVQPMPLFLQRMADRGWRVGDNIDFDFQVVADETSAVSELMRGRTGGTIDVVIVLTLTMAFAVKEVTPHVPIVVIAASDPVAVGAAASLARPGGTITGTSLMAPELAAKRLEYLLAFRPQPRRIAFLYNPVAALDLQLAVDPVRRTATDMGTELRLFGASNLEELEAAVSAIADWNAEGVVVMDNAFIFVARAPLVAAMIQRKLPFACPFPEMARDGCLFSYSASVSERFLRCADYVDKILRGANPGELPFDQPTKFELVINLKTAKALGITPPEILLTTADEVIE
ncbi:MAG: ABC transporter substrate-binding protein [Pseudolabrys sp.]|nr:ABC transporter substrate-binding protein [Pseudolabrys sp.]